MNTLRLRDMQASLWPDAASSVLRWSWGSSWRRMAANVVLPFLPGRVPAILANTYGDAVFDPVASGWVVHLAAAAAQDIRQRVALGRARQLRFNTGETPYGCKEAAADLLAMFRARHSGGNRPACTRIDFWRQGDDKTPSGDHSAVVVWFTPTAWEIIEPMTGMVHQLKPLEQRRIRRMVL